MRWNVLEPIRNHPWTRKLLLLAPMLVLVSLFTVTGFRGVDWGEHWDEAGWHIQPARDMVSSGVFLPHRYIYPAFGKWLTLAPALPAALKHGSDAHKIQEEMKRATSAPDYLLKVRRVFIVVSALTIVWIYGAALALRRKWWEAFIAAAGAGLSWEYAYHARWVANDCILAQFSALTMFMLVLFHRHHGRRTLWLYAAAIAAGLGTGTKYPGVVLLVPVMVSSVLTLPWYKVLTQVFRVTLVCGIAFAAYVVTTPGTLIEPFAFIDEIKLISTVYQGSHYGYTVAAGAQHWRVALTYLAYSYFSPYPALAIPMFLTVFVGAWAWLKADRRVGILLVGFPIAFLAFFCGRYSVMVARNYLLVTPFLAVLAARGFAEIFQRLRVQWLRWPLAAGLAAAMVAEAAWLVRAGEGIRHMDPMAYARHAITYVSKHPGTQFRVSPRVRSLAAAQNLALPSNVTEGEAQVVIFFVNAEGPNPRSDTWKSNDPWLTEAVFGPREVNVNWYAAWIGQDHVFAMTTKKAKAAGVALAQ